MTEPPPYQIRPTRAQMQHLPAFKGLTQRQIHLVNQDQAADFAFAQLSRCSQLGFDTESKPTFKVGERSTGPHLVQLATPEHGFLFPLDGAQSGTHSRALLRDILQSSHIVKVGFGLKSDRGPLLHKLGVTLGPTLELSSRVKQLGYQHPVGLQAAVAIVLGEYLVKSKRVALSNWSNPVLTPAQQAYAANDAYASLRVYQALERLTGGTQE